MKTCTKCDEVKALTEFHRDKSRKDGLANRCKPCVILHVKTYYVKNKDAVVARSIEWVNNNRERHNKKCSKWVKRNRGAVNARTARRYAAKTKATPVWAAPGTEQHWLINEIYDLAVFRSKLTGVPWEVDHKYPLRGSEVSGLHVPDNLQVVLMTENRRKSNRVQVT
jgi:hypothetical protein